MQILSDMAMAVSVQGEDLRVPGYEDEVKFLLHHALASGAYGQGSRTHEPSQCGESVPLRFASHDREAHCIKGSCRDSGFDRAFPQQGGEIDELLDEFHCPIGLSVAQKWKLPRPVQISISCYRNYSEATEFRDQTAMTYLADRLATWAVFPEKLPTRESHRRSSVC